MDKLFCVQIQINSDTIFKYLEKVSGLSGLDETWIDSVEYSDEGNWIFNLIPWKDHPDNQ